MVNYKGRTIVRRREDISLSFSRIAFVVFFFFFINVAYLSSTRRSQPVHLYFHAADISPALSLGILITIFKRCSATRFFRRRIGAVYRSDLPRSRETRGKTTASLHTILRSLYLRFTSDDRRASTAVDLLPDAWCKKRGPTTRGKSRRAEGKIWSEAR